MKVFMLTMVILSSLFGVVDINNAKTKELTSLKGIGKKKARAIIRYRKQHCFRSVDEIVNVKGIGPKFLEKNRANMKIGECQR